MMSKVVLLMLIDERLPQTGWRAAVSLVRMVGREVIVFLGTATGGGLGWSAGWKRGVEEQLV
ncbi:hypothetical protein C8R44DRAFT_794753 [Mycena epipterygia]|nr:hypothetical protein C8R44DRAFT_794753 [Mycena epipterygia]